MTKAEKIRKIQGILELKDSRGDLYGSVEDNGRSENKLWGLYDYRSRLTVMKNWNEFRVRIMSFVQHC